MSDRPGLGGALAWGVVLFLLWLLLAPSSSGVEAAVGAMAATAAAVAVHMAEATSPIVLRPDPGWLGRLVRLPVAVLRDSVLLVAALPRRPSGEFVTLAFEPEGSPPQVAARRALAIVTITLTPNTLAAGMDDTSVLVHRLLPSPRPVVPDR